MSDHHEETHYTEETLKTKTQEGVWQSDEKEEVVDVIDTRDIKKDLENDYTDVENLDEEDLDISNVNKIVGLTDDPELKCFTVRAMIVATGMAALSASIAQLMFFKPVSTPLSNTFVLMFAYVFSSLWSRFIPQGGWLNPFPFNHKEFACIYVCVNAANASAYATWIISAQDLYYKAQPSEAGAFFLILATQMVGYGIAGQLRRFLVFPPNMIWPQTLPIVTMIKSLAHDDKSHSQKRARYFFIVFGIIFVYEIIPQYMFPMLGAFSIFCLAKNDSPMFQHLFGGSGVNEGLGILELCFDWNYLTYYTPLVLPMWVQANIYGGILLMWLIIPLLYYTNVWNAQNFKFLSNAIWAINQTDGTSYVYPQADILDQDNAINFTAVDEIGNPLYATSLAFSYIIINMGVTASITHIILFYGKQIWASFKNARSSYHDFDDPHNKLMQSYKEVPNWWYYIIYVLGMAINIGLAYANHSSLPAWGVIFAIVLSTVLSLPMNMIQAVTGQGFGLNVVAEMIFGFIMPGYPVANMYFKTLGFNTLYQAGNMGNDLKVGHYMKVPPRFTFGFQLWGTLIGSIFNYIVNISVLKNEREVLLDQNGGTNIWSGAGPQTINSAAITWGGIGPMRMFGPSTPYYMVLYAFIIGFAAPIPGYVLHRLFPNVGFKYINVPMIMIGLATLPGTNASWITCSMILVIVSQWFVKRRYHNWYIKYNYLTSAALDSGTSLMVFFLGFAVYGSGSGVVYNFPIWWGNRLDADHLDQCCLNC
ncbi:OPT family small oligopeptide transporter [Hesseltinella vesiculosa]|uniref:OPT family small oligopeptide transporter n=1 Tax=Hesseltinella vesiculosa TaxID=101127 RepID=A0A1X2GPP6_9FUNG|nr:OPT family small oligopeptide transporter [Hesseltinella vesiculosa]